MATNSDKGKAETFTKEQVLSMLAAIGADETPASAPAAPAAPAIAPVGQFAPRMANSGAIKKQRDDVQQWNGTCSGHGETQEERDASAKHRISFDARGYGIRPKSGKPEVFDWEKGCNGRAAYQTFIRRDK